MQCKNARYVGLFHSLHPISTRRKVLYCSRHVFQLSLILRTCLRGEDEDRGMLVFPTCPIQATSNPAPLSLSLSFSLHHILRLYFSSSVLSFNRFFFIRFSQIDTSRSLSSYLSPNRVYLFLSVFLSASHLGFQTHAPHLISEMQLDSSIIYYSIISLKLDQSYYYGRRSKIDSCLSYTFFFFIKPTFFNYSFSLSLSLLSRSFSLLFKSLCSSLSFSCRLYLFGDMREREREREREKERERKEKKVMGDGRGRKGDS